jgi:hypothetical protein
MKRYKFNQLSEQAKQRVRDHHTEGLDYEWWDYQYADFVETARLLGVEVDTKYREGADGKIVEDPDISFSGFWSQGDGASFSGNLRLLADKPLCRCDNILKDRPDDKVLLCVADILDGFHSKCRLIAPEYDQIVVSVYKERNLQYVHSNTMQVDEDRFSEWFDYDDDMNITQAELMLREDLVEVLEAFRTLADWLYNQLETTYEYLCSDEAIIERDDRFDKEGAAV